MFTRREFVKFAGLSSAALATSCRGLMLGAPNTTDPGLSDRIEHVIFTMQENRSFDHYFGVLPEYRAQRGIPGVVDGFPPDAGNPSFEGTEIIRPYHLSTQCHENLSPSWNESHIQWNRDDPATGPPLLNGFVRTAAGFSRALADKEGTIDFEGRRAMGFYDASDLPFYYELASQFAISDRHFASVPAGTLANRLYFLGGSSYGRVYAEFPPPQQIPANSIFDVLELAGISWKIYLKGDSFYAFFTTSNQHLSDGRIVDAEQFFTDAAEDRLPQVAMIELGLDTGFDEHPRNNIQTGSAFMKQFYDALMGSPAWEKSVMFQTYDEPGGFYDHVVPPAAIPPDNFEPALQPNDVPGRFDRLGFRVPLLVVSPWVKPHYVSNQVSDHTSVMKFIERRFGLPSLTQRDAAAHDLLDMFDFSKMSFSEPPPMPKQPTGGVCDPGRVAV